MDSELLPDLAPTAAMERLFSIHELFEEILGYLPLHDLFVIQRVNRLWHRYINTSRILQRLMFLTPSPLGTVIPIRTATTLRGRPQRHAIWAKTPEVDTSKFATYIVRGRIDRLPNPTLLSLCKHTVVEPPALNPVLEYYKLNRKLDTILLKESPVSHADVALRLVPHSCKSVPLYDSRRRMLVTQPPVADVVIGRSDTLWGLYEAHNINGVTIGDLLDAEEKTYGHFKAPSEGMTSFVAYLPSRR